MPVQKKYIIVGAGLSGLTMAMELMRSGEDDFLLIEGSSRLGGRIKTSDNVDFGATWFNQTHKHLNALINELGLGKFEQYRDGKSQLIYSTMAPPHYFEAESGELPTYRVSNGSSALIQALAEKVEGKVLLNTKVERIEEASDGIEVHTDKGVFRANKVIVTIPPKLATGLTYAPELPPYLEKAMKETHTWMSNAIKVGLTFDRPFWREKGLSGTVIGQIAPVIEMYDHTSADDRTFSLMGFVNEGLRDASASERKERILAYLESCFGEEVRAFKTYEEKDWSADRFTSCVNLKSVYMSPSYGHAAFQAFYMSGKLVFSGTETSSEFGGYLEGAVISGKRTAQKILKSAL